MSRNYAFAPRLMQASAAAHYLGVSASKFRTLGIKPKRHEGNVLYDIRDLDDWADHLSYEGEQKCNEQQLADRLFGIAAE